MLLAVVIGQTVPNAPCCCNWAQSSRRSLLLELDTQFQALLAVVIGHKVPYSLCCAQHQCSLICFFFLLLILFSSQQLLVPCHWSFLFHALTFYFPQLFSVHLIMFWFCLFINSCNGVSFIGPVALVLFIFIISVIISADVSVLSRCSSFHVMASQLLVLMSQFCQFVTSCNGLSVISAVSVLLVHQFM